MAETSVASLNRQIARKGELVVLRRPVANQPAIEKTVMAFCRGYRPEEIAGGITAGESAVILSHSSLDGWPVPPRAADTVTYQGRTRRILSVSAVKIGETLLRYDLRVAG